MACSGRWPDTSGTARGAGPWDTTSVTRRAPGQLLALLDDVEHRARRRLLVVCSRLGWAEH